MRFPTAMSLAGALFGALFLAACEQPPPEQPEVIRPVRIMTIAELQAGSTITYPGAIQGIQNAELAFEVPGRIIELPVLEGTVVKEGELLARVDPADFHAALDEAEAKYRQSRDTFERFEEVFERGAISRQELDNRRRMYEVDRARLATAQKAVSDTQLRAPFDGRVGRTFVENFNNVQAKQSVLLLQDLSQLEIVVSVPEQDWLKAKPGLTLAQRTERASPQVSLSAFPDRGFAATLSEVATAADPVTRTFQARARFDPPDDLGILPGMSANISITIPDNLTADESVPFIPANAVIAADDGKTFVWKVDPATMTVSRAEVQLGQLSGADTEVAAGLEAGDRIAVTGVHSLREGMRVREL